MSHLDKAVEVVAEPESVATVAMQHIVQQPKVAECCTDDLWGKPAHECCVAVRRDVSAALLDAHERDDELHSCCNWGCDVCGLLSKQLGLGLC